MDVAGMNFGQTSANLTGSLAFGLGDRARHGGKIYVFVKSTSAISAYDVVTFDETYKTAVAPVTTSIAARGDLIGVAPVAFASGDYGWLQVYGPCTMKVLASCAANIRLMTTSAAGALDDEVGVDDAITVDGIHLTAARGGTDGSAAGVLNFPQLGATIAGVP